MTLLIHQLAILFYSKVKNDLARLFMAYNEVNKYWDRVTQKVDREEVQGAFHREISQK